MGTTPDLITLLRSYGFEPFGHVTEDRSGYCLAVYVLQNQFLPPDLTDYAVAGSICYWPDIPWRP